MPKQVRKIPVEQLNVGMHVEDVLNARGFLLFSANTRIDTPEQIDQLRKQGVKSVFVSVDVDGRATDAVEAPLPGGRENGEMQGYCPDRFRRELMKGRDLYAETICQIHDVMQAARMGRLFSINPVQDTAERFIESLRRDPNTLIAVSQIKRYSYDVYAHSINVGIMVAALCSAIGYDGEELHNSCVGGLLHDIGKMRLPESLLRKAGRFTKHDMAVMQKHPELGIELLQSNHALSDPGSAIVVHHHERFNGSGYPRRLVGADIDEITFVAGLADVYDAMTTNRPHRSAYLPQESLAIIFQGSDELFPRQLVEHFTRLLGIYPVGSFVRLESGEMGIVVHISAEHLLKPVVLLLFDANGSRYREPFECDLSAVSGNPGVHIPRIEGSLDPKTYNVDPGLCLQEMIARQA